MKYFTPERYIALQNPCDDTALEAAEADWEKAVDEYGGYLQAIWPKLPGAVQELVGRFYLHDADVLSMGRKGDSFVIVMQLDPPPNELLTITYKLTDSPEVDYEALPEDQRTAAPNWLCDELDVKGEDNGATFVHAILLSNGWELRLPFRDVQMTTATPMFPMSAKHAVAPTMS